MQFQFYMEAIYLPLAAFDLIATPILLSYVADSQSLDAIYSMFIPFVISFLAGNVFYFIYTLPGLSKLYGIDSGTIYCWMMLSSMALVLFIGMGIGVYFALYPPTSYQEELLSEHPPEWALVIASDAEDFFIGTKTVSVSKDGTITAFIKSLPRENDAGKKVKLAAISNLTKEVKESKASLFSFRLLAVECQCSTEKYAVRGYIECDQQGNFLNTAKLLTDTVFSKPEPSSVFYYQLQAICNLARKRNLLQSEQSLTSNSANTQPTPIEKPNPQSPSQKAAFAKAQSILARIHKGEDFAALAKKYSDDPSSKDSGGEYDFFMRGQMIPEIEQVAFSLNSGEVSDIVETNIGYHVIKTEEYQNRGTPFERVRVRHILISAQPNASN